MPNRPERRKSVVRWQKWETPERRRGDAGEFQEATPGGGQPPDQELKTDRRVPDPSHQDFTRPGPPASPFLCVARLPERAASCSRPMSVCARGQDENSRATGPSSTPAARPERRPRLSCRLLPEAGVRASVPVGRTRVVGLRARALHPAARPERRRRLLVPPSRLLTSPSQSWRAPVARQCPAQYTQTNTTTLSSRLHEALRSSALDDQTWATQHAREAAARQALDVPSWEA
ncbi:uncharacterized protein LOC142568287 [Dermacentor variabilis]|uniref:uncharacterized protein LOC142568287 n=1 Tax=Dermacentor variabilis TaxID=34621 RepID=UPI003F5B5659